MTLSLQPVELTGAQAALKRVEDIVASTIGLVVISPLLVGVGIAVKVTSRGPFLFRQERVGRHGRRSRC